MAEIMSGKLVSSAVRDRISNEVRELTQKGITPTLAVILVGNNPASLVYVRNKHKACLETGMNSVQISCCQL